MDLDRRRQTKPQESAREDDSSGSLSEATVNRTDLHLTRASHPSQGR